MKTIPLLLLFLLTSIGHTTKYTNEEIREVLNNIDLQNLSQSYSQNYYTSKQPDQVINQILKADLTPLQREYVLHTLLTQISQQPPQNYHQYLVDLMKTYQVKATKTALEGPFPVAIFNLNSKAHGIENIWTAYRSEQLFNQLFNKNIGQAVAAIKIVVADKTPQNRPRWLGIKNSIAALSQAQLSDLSNHLSTQIKDNNGLDRLISHVALASAEIFLIEKALQSKSRTIREYTLRNLSTHLPPEQAKSLLISSATHSFDSKLSTALLSQYISDKSVQTFLTKQLGNVATAETAAFALSQSNDLTLPEQLKKQYIQADQIIEKNHVLLTLQLSQSDAAKIVLGDLKPYIEPSSAASQWLKSFTPKTRKGGR